MSVPFDQLYDFLDLHLDGCDQNGNTTGGNVGISAAGPQRSLWARCNVCGAEFKVALSVEDTDAVIEFFGDPKTFEDAVRKSRRDVH